jgi:hypothetical protein
MNSTLIEPLDPETWLNQLAQLHAAAMGRDVRRSESFFRRAFHLTKLAPGPYRELLPVEVGEADLEGFLKQGAYESAMMALLSPEAGLTISKPLGEAKYAVEVVLEDSTPAGTSSHKFLGKAILCAWICALSHLAGIDLLGGVSRRDRRKSRSGSHQNSTAH